MEPEQSPTNYRPIKTSIPGLTLVPSFITLQQEKYLIQCIKQQQWNNSLKRRTQHYGYEYSYDRKSIAKPTQPIPEWCIPIKARLQKLLNQKTSEQQKIIFDQMIINEYEPGQGISPHIDNINLFKDIIVSLSLSSDCIMIFQKVVKDKKRENLQQPPQERNSHSKQQIQLKRRSLTIMQKQSRYDWKHSIPARKKDNGNQRLVRYSLTFRKMKI